MKITVCSPTLTLMCSINKIWSIKYLTCFVFFNLLILIYLSSSCTIFSNSVWNIFFTFFFLLFLFYLKNPLKVDPVTTCKGPPALSCLVLLPSSNVTWMSDCANAGTSLAVGKQHLIQPQKGWELSLTSPGWIMWALPVIARPPLVLYCHLSATHRPRPNRPDWAGRAARVCSAPKRVLATWWAQHCSHVQLEMRSF